MSPSLFALHCANTFGCVRGCGWWVVCVIIHNCMPHTYTSAGLVSDAMERAIPKAKSSSDEIILHFSCLLKREPTLWMFSVCGKY